MKKLLDQFKKEYNYIYDAQTAGGFIPGYMEAVADFDKLATTEKVSAILADFIQARGDFISSDREAAAFMFALEALHIFL